MAEERLQKIIAAAGLASRRKAEDLIVNGHVSVNGRTITELGSKADVEVDDIKVDGHRLSAPKNFLYIALNKPTNVVTTVHDPQGRETVMQFFKGLRERIYPVGRLDYASEGLILLTNDGDFAAKLMSPASEVTKTYLAKANGILTTEQEEQFRRGIPMHGRRTAPAGLKLIKKNVNPWYEVRLVEGRQNQIRIMFKHFGRLVEKLKRVKIGFLELGALKPGAYRTLTRSEVERFQKLLSAPHSVEAGVAAEHLGHGAGERSPFRPAPPPSAMRPSSGAPSEQKRFESKPFDPRKKGPSERPTHPFVQQKPPEHQTKFTPAMSSRVQQKWAGSRTADPTSGSRKPFVPRGGEESEARSRPPRTFEPRGEQRGGHPREQRGGEQRPPEQRASFPPTRLPGARKWARAAKSETRKPFLPRNDESDESLDRAPGSGPRKTFAPTRSQSSGKWAGPPKSTGPRKPFVPRNAEQSEGSSRPPRSFSRQNNAGPRKPFATSGPPAPRKWAGPPQSEERLRSSGNRKPSGLSPRSVPPGQESAPPSQKKWAGLRKPQAAGSRSGARNNSGSRPPGKRPNTKRPGSRDRRDQ